MHCPQKTLTSLIFNTIISIGEGLINLHNFFDTVGHLKCTFKAHTDCFVHLCGHHGHTFMSSLCGVGVHVHVCVNNFSKKKGPETCSFFLERYLIYQG